MTNTVIIRSCIAILALIVASPAWAQTPFMLAPEAFDGTGGDSVTGSGRFSIIADEETCKVWIFELEFAGMVWLDTGGSPIGSIPSSKCDSAGAPITGFGQSSSLAGDILVVGLPEWDIGTRTDSGGIAVFVRLNNNWSHENIGNSGASTSNFVLVSPDAASNLIGANGARFGHSVSIARNGTTDQYIIVVGAPQFNGAAGAATGKVYFYNLNKQGNGVSINLVGSIEGTTPAEQLGYSVTTDYPYALVGAPGVFQVNQGKALFFDVHNSSSVTTLSTGIGYNLGVEVSLSPELALISSSEDAVAFRNVGTPPARDYQLVTSHAFQSFGGDVSQSGGVAAFGDRAPSSLGAQIYRDPVDDSTTPGVDRIDIPVGSDFPSDDLTDIGLDIRLVDESLWFANAGFNSSTDRGILYMFPCGYGTRLKAAEYALVSIPCDVPGSATINSVFGHLGAIGDKSDIRLYAYDPGNPAALKPTREILNGSQTFSQLGIVPNQFAFWVITDEDQYFAVPTANGFTVSQPNTGPIPQNSPIRRQFPVTLPSPADDGSGNVIARVMVANPFPRHFEWEHLYYSADGTNFANLQGSQQIDPTIFLYDPTITGGQPYKAISGVTPGFEDSVEPYQGFWIKLNPGPNPGTNGGVLRLPQVE